MNEHADRQRLLEALLFAAPAPLAEEELAQRLGEDADIPGLLREMAAQYAERGVNLVRLAGGWSFRTAPPARSRGTSSARIPSGSRPGTPPRPTESSWRRWTPSS